MSSINNEVGYKFIRDKILAGNFPPGMPLLTRELAKEIGISRTPVRDALRQLETEGLVTIRSRLGAAVRSMDPREFKELCVVRQGLESLAAGLAALNRTPADLDDIKVGLEAMRTIIEKMRRARDDEPFLGELIREDVHFHHAIVSASKNELLKTEIHRLRLVTRVVSKSSPLTAYRGLEMRIADFRDHEHVYRAIAEQNVEAAKAAMEAALQNSVLHSIELMAKTRRAELQSDFGLQEDGSAKQPAETNEPRPRRRATRATSRSTATPS